MLNCLNKPWEIPVLFHRKTPIRKNAAFGQEVLTGLLEVIFSLFSGLGFQRHNKIGQFTENKERTYLGGHGNLLPVLRLLAAGRRGIVL